MFDCNQSFVGTGLDCSRCSLSEGYVCSKEMVIKNNVFSRLDNSSVDFETIHYSKAVCSVVGQL